jgi:hypothetical protein
MIDTVEFRIHDLQKHKAVAIWLDRKMNKTGKSISISTGEEEFSVEQKINFRTFIKYHDTGNEQQVAHFNELKSNHYNIAYKIDYIRDFIAFNVSIPKYVYGTNVVLYNTGPMAKDFVYHKHSSIEQNLADSYRRLFRFFDKFFLKQFGEITIDRRDVEVNRIDICYNQVFSSKEASIDYLNELRKLKKKYARDATNYSRDWKTSIVYKTERYSFKVYHKGTEFAKNDAKKLREVNESGAGKFDVDHYQKFADKILRYEMTFRNSQISYLFMNHLFRKDCYIWQAGVKLWKTSKAKKAVQENYMTYRASLEPHEKHAIDYVNAKINKVKKFYLEDNPKSAKFDDEMDPDKFERYPSKQERFNQASFFSKSLFRLLGKQFCKLLEEFRLHLHENATSVLTRLDQHNAAIDNHRATLERMKVPAGDKMYKGVGKKISVQKIKMLLRLLETETFEEIAEKNYFSRQTWYNHRRELAQLGVKQSSLLAVTIPSALDLANYNYEMIHNGHKYKNINF